jgi:hypothetical protein
VFIECSNLTVQTGGEINVDFLGYGGGIAANGYGPGRGFFAAVGNRGGGGGYGGWGGAGDNTNAYGGATYGTASNPTNPGSGGAGIIGAYGGAGGGYIRIMAAETIALHGSISANGNNASGNYDGGGSGGGIHLQCGRLLGNGTIQAHGGNAGTAEAGGGGGGRIAILVRKIPFYTGGTVVFTATVNGGTALNDGYPGTIYCDFKPRGTVFSAW